MRFSMRMTALVVLLIIGSTSVSSAQDSVRVLATSKTSTMEKEMNKTSTMQRELQEAGDAGYEYRSQTVFKSAFGGKEVVVIVERDSSTVSAARYEYRLLATKKTSTMEKEIREATEAGFEFVGLTVAATALGGTELVTILRRASE